MYKNIVGLQPNVADGERHTFSANRAYDIETSVVVCLIDSYS